MFCDGDDGKTKKACRCCAKEGLKRGAWSVHEDRILKSYMKTHGEGKWRELPEKAGKDRPTSKQIKLHFNNTSLHQCIQMGLYVYLRLMRCGRSCRFRWFNYLRPDIKRGNISQDEEDLILRLHRLLGNRWSLIAGRLPGRTDTEIKNHWKTTLRWKLKGKTTKKQLKRSKNKKLKGTSSAAAPCDEVSISQQEGNHMNTKNTEIALDKENSSRSVDESLNFLMDSDIGDICISDFLTSDFLQVCCDEIHEDKNATGGDHGRNDNSFCCVGHPFSTHEMIENSSHEAILENRTGCDTAQTNSTWELSWLNFVPGFRE